MRELTGWSKDLRVAADGDGVVAMVGVAGLRMLADRAGLTAGISTVLTRPGFDPVHDRGRVLTDIACSIAAGGTDLYDIEALRAQAALFGPVAPDTTALRALGEISDGGPPYRRRAGGGSRAHVEPATGRCAAGDLRRWDIYGRHGHAACRRHHHRGPLP